LTLLDVRRLRLLRELQARGTIAAVADALSYTPSAVSQQLAVLERETGVQLLEKVGRGVRLTEPARRLVSHADVVIARLELAEAELAAASGEARGRVRIVGFQTAVRGLIAPAIPIIAKRHPELRPEVLEQEAEEALPLLRSGDADVVIAEEYEHAPRPRDPAYERVELCQDPMRVVLPPDHPAAAGRSVRLADLRDDVWATAREDTAFADMFVRVCRARGGFDPDVRHRVNDIRLLIQLAAAGLAVSLVPGLGRPEAESGVAVRDVHETGMTRHIFAAVRAGSASHPSVAAVLDALHEQVLTLELG
jgi:DNA-binding transcriptional LysR family regulator